MVEMLTFPNREEWLKARGHTIGGSDASAIVGMNPYKTNEQLWLEKTGQIIPEDISEKPYVKYGTNAEPLLRELFKLDFPQYQVFYEENNLFHLFSAAVWPGGFFFMKKTFLNLKVLRTWCIVQ